MGRLISQLPVGLCEIFIKEVFENKMPDFEDEETSNILRVFFKNDLNIAETSRQLFMHRNTLVYRLEKLAKETGLDVRHFDDALLYMIVKMVIKHIRRKNEQKEDFYGKII
jgi:carbohydrate diacid regulator